MCKAHSLFLACINKFGSTDAKPSQPSRLNNTGIIQYGHFSPQGVEFASSRNKGGILYEVVSTQLAV